MATLNTTGYGTGKFYDKHIYNPGRHSGAETIPIYLDSPPTTALAWFHTLQLANHPKHILDMAGGEGRNIAEARRLFPGTTIVGFDGSPNAIARLRQAYPEMIAAVGDMHGRWPLDELGVTQFDVIFDITSGIPESPNLLALNTYAGSLSRALAPRGYAIIEAIAPDDSLAASWEYLGSDDASSIVLWRFENDEKPERVMTLEQARKLYATHGFRIVATRIHKFLDAGFGKTDLHRKYIQLVIQRP